MTLKASRLCGARSFVRVVDTWLDGTCLRVDVAWLEWLEANRRTSARGGRYRSNFDIENSHICINVHFKRTICHNLALAVFVCDFSER